MHSGQKAFFASVDVKGKSVLDVGCAGGEFCIQMLDRGASRVTGLDYCASPKLRENTQNKLFTYVQMDVFSEKLFHLPQHDIVTCAGVLYHVENPLSLLMRLRSLTRETLFVETAISKGYEDTPVMLFHKDRTLGNNPSNWWTPNKLCLQEMLVVARFENVRFVGSYPAKKSAPARVSVVCNVSNKTFYDKAAPRSVSKMDIIGDDRDAHHG